MAQLKNYAVTFVGDYFTLTTNTEARTFQQAEKIARELLLEHYGYDMDDTANEVQIVEND
jgi:hypothetical protein